MFNLSKELDKEVLKDFGYFVMITVSVFIYLFAARRASTFTRVKLSAQLIKEPFWILVLNSAFYLPIPTPGIYLEPLGRSGLEEGVHLKLEL